MMRLVAGRRTWTAKTVGSKVGSALDGALGDQFLLHVACALGQCARACRNVEYDPVPPAAAGRRVRIIHGDGKALGAGRRPAPVQGWRDIAPGAAAAFEHLLVADG